MRRSLELCIHYGSSVYDAHSFTDPPLLAFTLLLLLAAATTRGARHDVLFILLLLEPRAFPLVPFFQCSRGQSAISFSRRSISFVSIRSSCSLFNGQQYATCLQPPHLSRFRSEVSLRHQAHQRCSPLSSASSTGMMRRGPSFVYCPGE